MYLIPYHYKYYYNEQTYIKIFVNIADTCIRSLEIVNKPLGERKKKKTSWYFLIDIAELLSSYINFKPIPENMMVPIMLLSCY